MKTKKYVFLIVTIVFTAHAEKKPLQKNIEPIKVEKNREQKAAYMDLYDNMLDDMISCGAVEEKDMKAPSMPWWKMWLLRAGDSLVARYIACREFLKKKYEEYKYQWILGKASARLSCKKLTKKYHI
jgi:hypothetical protein